MNFKYIVITLCIAMPSIITKAHTNPLKNGINEDFDKAINSLPSNNWLSVVKIFIPSLDRYQSDLAQEQLFVSDGLNRMKDSFNKNHENITDTDRLIKSYNEHALNLKNNPTIIIIQQNFLGFRNVEILPFNEHNNCQSLSSNAQKIIVHPNDNLDKFDTIGQLNWFTKRYIKNTYQNYEKRRQDALNRVDKIIFSILLDHTN